jgi:hypothetical protein
MSRSLAALVRTAALARRVAPTATMQSATSGRSALRPGSQNDMFSGQKAEVALDAGFIEALGTLKPTGGSVRDGTITNDGVGASARHCSSATAAR